MASIYVRIVGLAKQTYLNGCVGRVDPNAAISDTDRVVVELGCGKKVSVKRENLQAASKERRDIARSITSALPSVGHDKLSVEKVLLPWCRRIAAEDPGFWQQARADIYNYLFLKVQHVVNTKRKIGQMGWAFRQTQPENVRRCLVWADGTPRQTSPFTHPTPGEQWWPCIIIINPVDQQYIQLKLLPFYCPVLALNDSRPWEVHASRIRCIDMDTIDTPGPTFEEVSENPPSIELDLTML